MQHLQNLRGAPKYKRPSRLLPTNAARHSVSPKAPRAYTTPHEDARRGAEANFRHRQSFAETKRMRQIAILSTSLLLYLLTSLSATAQLPPVKDSLNPIQSSQSPAACSTTDASSCAQAAAKILPQVMGPSPMEENLRRLTDEIGGRVTGSPEMAKAVAWAVAAFRAEGVDAHTEKYTLPATWSEGDTRIELLGPVKFPIRLVSEAWAPATPPGGIEANVIDVGDGTEADFAKVTADLKGAILLIHNNAIVTYQDLTNEWAKPLPIVARAVKEGAAAILWMGA